MSTALLPETLTNKIGASGIDVDMLAFIEIEQNKNAETTAAINSLAQENIYAVFTSSNAVAAVSQLINSKPDWKIFCVGKATAELANSCFDNSVIGIANDAAALAALILQHKEISEVVFFCGDMRREELPQILQQKAVKIKELPVYRTTLTPEKVTHPYDAILFFSPSAAESFFSLNNIGAETVLFAIGNTTTTALRTKTANTIIIGRQPGKEQLINEMIRYFTAINKTIQ